MVPGFPIRSITVIVGRAADFDTKPACCQVCDEVVQTEHDCGKDGEVHDDLLQDYGFHHGSCLVSFGQALGERCNLHNGSYADSARCQSVAPEQVVNILTTVWYQAASSLWPLSETLP